MTLNAIQRNLIDSDGNFPTQDAAPMDTGRLLSDQTYHQTLALCVRLGGNFWGRKNCKYSEPSSPTSCFEVTKISQVHHWCTFDFIVRIIPGTRPGWRVEPSQGKRIFYPTTLRCILCAPLKIALLQLYTFANLNVVCIIGKPVLVAGFRCKQLATRQWQGRMVAPTTLIGT